MKSKAKDMKSKDKDMTFLEDNNTELQWQMAYLRIYQ